MRPINETQADRHAQREVIERFLPVYRYEKAVEADHLAFYDFKLYKGGAVQAIAEVKCRGAQYQDMILSLHKWQKLEAAAITPHELVEFFSVFLIYSFPHEIRWLQVKENMAKHWRVAKAGRADRGQTNDIEPCLHIPLELMELLQVCSAHE